MEKKVWAYKKILLTDCFDRKDRLEKDKEYSCIKDMGHSLLKSV